MLNGRETAFEIVITEKWDAGPLSTKFNAARDLLKASGGLTMEQIRNAEAAGKSEAETTGVHRIIKPAGIKVFLTYFCYI